MTNYLIDYLRKNNCLYAPKISEVEKTYIAQYIAGNLEDFIQEAVNIQQYRIGKLTRKCAYISLDKISYGTPTFFSRLIDFTLDDSPIGKNLLLGSTGCPVILGWPSDSVKDILSDKLEMRKQSAWVCDRQYSLELIGQKTTGQAKEVFDVLFKKKKTIADVIFKELGWEGISKKQAVSTQLSRLYESNLIWRRKIARSDHEGYEFTGSWAYEYIIPVITEENNLSPTELRPQLLA